MKKNTVIFIFSCLLLCAAGIISSCHRITGHYNLSGTLIDTCGGQRIGNRPLVVLYTEPRYSRVIGRGVSDAAGYFSISCESISNGQITMIDTLTGQKYFALLQPAPYGHTEYPLGFVYTDHGTYKATVKLTVNGTFGPNDTLFLGSASTGANYHYYYPVIAGATYMDVFHRNAGSGIRKQFEYGLKWEVGFAEFKKSSRSVPVVYNICEYPDTTSTVTINYP